MVNNPIINPKIVTTEIMISNMPMNLELKNRAIQEKNSGLQLMRPTRSSKEILTTAF